MKILVLTSRYTATRDIIGEDFGRQTRLFSALKKFNHNIDFFLADYKKFEKKNVKMRGINVIIRPFGIIYFFSFVKTLNKILKNNNYDFLLASSDPLWGIIGYIYAKKNRIKFIYDLHDNYEVYGIYKIPFFGYIDNFVIRNSDIVTTVSYSLKDKIKSKRKHNVFVIQNGVDVDLFKPMNKLACKKSLKLAKDTKIIAYAGSIQRAQGINMLIDVFTDLKKEIKNVKLVIAGRFFRREEKKIDLKKDGIIYLGSLPQHKVVKLINSADVVVVPNPENEFTKYCFPYKIVEYMACNRPIVATKVGDVAKLLEKFPDSVCLPNNKEDMKNKIKKQIKIREKNYKKYAEKYSWDNIALKLDKIIKSYKES